MKPGSQVAVRADNVVEKKGKKFTLSIKLAVQVCGA